MKAGAPTAGAKPKRTTKAARAKVKKGNPAAKSSQKKFQEKLEEKLQEDRGQEAYAEARLGQSLANRAGRIRSSTENIALCNVLGNPDSTNPSPAFFVSGGGRSPIPRLRSTRSYAPTTRAKYSSKVREVRHVFTPISRFSFRRQP
jgi:hypothetical protein